MYNFDQEVERKNTDCLKWDTIADQDMLPMWVADMDFKAPKEVIDALKGRVEHGIFGYAGGYDSFYQAISNWMTTRHQWNINQEWICTSPGVVPALSMLVSCLTNPGDKVIIQPPVYYPFFDVVKNNGCQVVENPLQFNGTRYTMDFKDLKKKFCPRVKLMILCSPHNPVGRVWTKQELQQLGELCIEHSVTVIADEIHSDLIFSGNEHTVFASIAEEFKQNSIICNSPSKTFNLAGIQASNIIIPDKKIRNLFKHSLVRNGLKRPNVFAITALEAAYRHGADWLEELLVYLQKNLNFLLDYIAAEIPGVKAVKPEGTYLVWLDFRELGLTDSELDTLVRREAKLVLNPGHSFGSQGSGFQRINIACPRAVLEEGLRRLKQAINNSFK